MASDAPKTTWMDHLGLGIKILRELRRISQAKLARAAGIGKSQLSKYESGKETPRLESLAKVLAALGASPLNLFFVVDFLDRMKREEAEGGRRLDASFDPFLSDSELEDLSMLRDFLGLFRVKAELRLRQGKATEPGEEDKSIARLLPERESGQPSRKVRSTIKW